MLGKCRAIAISDAFLGIHACKDFYTLTILARHDGVNIDMLITQSIFAQFKLVLGLFNSISPSLLCVLNQLVFILISCIKLCSL